MGRLSSWRWGSLGEASGVRPRGVHLSPLWDRAKAALGLSGRSGMQTRSSEA